MREWLREINNLSRLLSVAIILASLFFNFYAFAQDGMDPTNMDLGEEYTGYRKTKPGYSAPSKRGTPSKSSRRSSSDNKGENIAKAALLYIPNRILDIVDIFKVDVGVGPATGGVLRLTKYAQMGYRHFYPGSFRFGLNGRDYPVFIEDRDERGFGPNFVASPERNITPAEIGVGLDVLVVGGYFGVSLDQMVDFIAGLVGLDPEGDDY